MSYLLLQFLVFNINEKIEIKNYLDSFKVVVIYFNCLNPDLPASICEEMTKMFFKPLQEDSLFSIKFVNEEESVYDVLVTGDFKVHNFTDISLNYFISTKSGFSKEVRVPEGKLRPITDSIKNSLYNVLSSLFIRTHPDSSQVLFNENVRGITPLLIRNIPKGNYRLRVEKEEYLPKDTVVSLVDKVDTLLLPLESKSKIKPNYATIVILLLPPCEIYLNDKFYGVSTYNSKLLVAPGKHKILLRNPIYGERTFHLNLEEKEVIHIGLFK